MDKEFQELQDLKDIIITTAKLMGYTIDTYKSTLEIYDDPEDWSIIVINLYQDPLSQKIILKTRFKQDMRMPFSTHEERINELNDLLNNL